MPECAGTTGVLYVAETVIAGLYLSIVGYHQLTCSGQDCARWCVSCLLKPQGALCRTTPEIHQIISYVGRSYSYTTSTKCISGIVYSYHCVLTAARQK